MNRLSSSTPFKLVSAQGNNMVQKGRDSHRMATKLWIPSKQCDLCSYFCSLSVFSLCLQALLGGRADPLGETLPHYLHKLVHTFANTFVNSPRLLKFQCATSSQVSQPHVPCCKITTRINGCDYQALILCN